MCLWLISAPSDIWCEKALAWLACIDLKKVSLMQRKFQKSFLSLLWNHFLCCFSFCQFNVFHFNDFATFLWLKLTCFVFRASQPVLATSSSATAGWLASYDRRKKMETKMVIKIDTKMKMLAIYCWRWGEYQHPFTSDTVSSLLPHNETVLRIMADVWNFGKRPTWKQGQLSVEACVPCRCALHMYVLHIYFVSV